VFKTGVLSKHMNNAYEIPESSCFHTTFQPFLADQCILAHSIRSPTNHDEGTSHIHHVLIWEPVNQPVLLTNDLHTFCLKHTVENSQYVPFLPRYLIPGGPVESHYCSSSAQSRSDLC